MFPNIHQQHNNIQWNSLIDHILHDQLPNCLHDYIIGLLYIDSYDWRKTKNVSQEYNYKMFSFAVKIWCALINSQTLQKFITRSQKRHPADESTALNSLFSESSSQNIKRYQLQADVFWAAVEHFECSIGKVLINIRVTIATLECHFRWHIVQQLWFGFLLEH